MKRTGLSSLLILVLLTVIPSGCGRRDGMDEVLLRYQNRKLVANSWGELFRADGYELLFSEDRGLTWKRLRTIPAKGYAVWGYSLACGGDDNLYFAQIGPGKGKKAVHVSRSLDNGKSWTIPVEANDEVWAQRTAPRVASQGQDVFLTWEEKAEMGPGGETRPSGIYFARSHDGGVTWSEDTWLRAGEDCSMTIGDDGSLNLSYVGGENAGVIYVSHSKDKGASWASEALGELRILIKEPYALSADGVLHLVFQGARPTLAHLSPGTSLDYLTFYAKSTDVGRTWSSLKEVKQEGGH